LIEALVLSGATDVAGKYQDRLFGAFPQLYTVRWFLEGPTYSQETPISPSFRPTILAAIALAAAAQNTEHPFDDVVVRRLVGDSDRSVIAGLALIILHELDDYGALSKIAARPGLAEIWSAASTMPPESSHRLWLVVSIAPSMPTLRDQGLALLQALLTQAGLPDETLAMAASVIADDYHLPNEAKQFMEKGGNRARGVLLPVIASQIAEARLRRGYDPDSARLVIEERVRDMRDKTMQPDMNPEPLNVLEAAGARAELRALGDDFSREARAGGRDTQAIGRLFALASDSYRRAGAGDQALTAAREGLAFVAPAIRAELGEDRWAEAMASADPARNAAAGAPYGYAAAPIAALCRAGASREAMAFGYTSGLERYRCAAQTGQAARLEWVIADGNSEILASEFMSAGNVDGARQLYDLLSREPPDEHFESQRQSLLGLMAAISGQPDRAVEHFSQAEVLVNQQEMLQEFWILQLAIDWGRAKAILATRNSPTP
jgi:hypothetical protein